jgi:putative transposase
MTRLYGWAPRGRRLVDKVPHGHWKTATFLAALRNDRIDVPARSVLGGLDATALKGVE